MEETEDDAASREGWQGVTPVQEDEGLAPVVRTRCSWEDAATMDLFNAVLKSGELSKRVLGLTEEARSIPKDRPFLPCTCSSMLCQILRDKTLISPNVDLVPVG